MIASTQHARGRMRGRRASTGFGIVSTEVNGALTYGSPVISRGPIAVREPVRPVGPSYPVGPVDPVYSGGPTQWGGNPPQAGGWPGSGYGGGYGYSSYQNPNNPTSQNNLAQLAELYNSNPSSLTQQQWQQLQAAGVIAPTVPYSNASLVSGTSSAIDPATGISYATELAEMQASGLTTTTTAASASSIMGIDPTNGATTIFGIDWYYLAAGLVLVYVMTGKRR